MYGIAGYLAYTSRWLKIAFKIIKASVYSDFRRAADASIYPPYRVKNWRTNIVIFSCHVLLFFFIHL